MKKMMGQMIYDEPIKTTKRFSIAKPGRIMGSPRI
jgi:hypothetical protein